MEKSYYLLLEEADKNTASYKEQQRKKALDKFQTILEKKVNDYRPNHEINKACRERTGEISYSVILTIYITNYGWLSIAKDDYEDQFVIKTVNRLEHIDDKEKAIKRFMYLTRLKTPK